MLISRISACASPSRSTSSRIVWPNAVNSWPERHRDGILQLRPAHLDEWVELVALREEGRRKLAHRRPQPFDRAMQRDLHGRRIHVIRRLAEIDVIVRDGRACSRRDPCPSSSSARLAITSFAFMFVEVPAPP